MLKVLDRIPAKLRNMLVLASYITMIVVVAAVGRHVAGEASAALPEASPMREKLEDFRSLALWLPLIGIPVTVFVQLHVQLRIVRALRHAAQVAISAADGDLTTTMQVHGHDELAVLASSFNTMTTQVGSAVRGMRETAERLTGAAHELETVSVSMQSSVRETVEKLDTVQACAKQAGDDLADINASTDKMQTAISDIGSDAAAVSTTAAAAVTNAEQATTNVTRLRESSRRIGDVVASITAIATQTHLLALNATIEAARAGEAGRGFAIVAGEVKDLAASTATATEEITTQINGIQADTEAAVAAVGDIARMIQSIAEHQNSISSYVREQSAVTSDMAAGAGQASASSGAIGDALTAVRHSADQASQASASTRAAAGDLTAMSRRLSELASTFRY
jgi:methyl-accepting chemotaxis protein